VPLARHFVLDSLGKLSQDMTDRVALIASELATNAVQHANTSFSVRVERTDSLIHVEVVDTGVGEPTVRAAQPHDYSGRGLRIVESLADEWGVRAEASGQGKAVWFVIQLGRSENLVSC
jgi:anti-sigma regulatory factor (Ser/Thr protein kinase)